MHEYKFYVWFNIFLAGDDVLNGCSQVAMGKENCTIAKPK